MDRSKNSSVTRAGVLRWRFYTQAKAKARQEVQQWIAEIMLRKEGLTSEIKLQPMEPEERFNG